MPCDERTESLVALFEHFGFEVTNDPNPEDEYDKVALYADEEGWTHAARVIADNVHHSKIGTAWDIHHSAGNVFSDSEYGSIYAYMKRAISDRYLTDIRKPKVGAITVSDY